MTREGLSIFVKGLEKSYGDKKVLRGVNLSVPQGTIYALLGSNGAGKTTTIRILTTQIKADRGIVKVQGYDTHQEPEQVHQAISLTGQFTAVDEALTGRENLVIMGKLRHVSKPKEMASKLLKDFTLSSWADRPVGTYSGGMKRKLDIAMSLVGNPSVIFLDEPTTGLDPQSRRSMWESIQQLKAAGVTIFLTTQYLEEAEYLADRIGILDKGRIIAEGSVEELKARFPHGEVEFEFFCEEDFRRAGLLLQGEKLFGKSKEQEEYADGLKEYKIRFFTDGKADTMARLIHRLYENQIPVKDFYKQEPDLEEVFLAMIEDKEEEIYESR